MFYLVCQLSKVANLGARIPNLRLMVDNREQFEVLAEFSKKHKIQKKWSLFIKVNMGSDRAGFDESPTLDGALFDLLQSPTKDCLSLYGFYCHAGHSYASSTEEQARHFLLNEIDSVNNACKEALNIDPSLKLQISVGATPTAHASRSLDISSIGELYGKLA